MKSMILYFLQRDRIIFLGLFGYFLIRYVAEIDQTNHQFFPISVLDFIESPVQTGVLGTSLVLQCYFPIAALIILRFQGLFNDEHLLIRVAIRREDILNRFIQFIVGGTLLFSVICIGVALIVGGGLQTFHNDWLTEQGSVYYFVQSRSTFSEMLPLLRVPVYLGIVWFFFVLSIIFFSLTTLFISLLIESQLMTFLFVILWNYFELAILSPNYGIRLFLNGLVTVNDLAHPIQLLTKLVSFCFMICVVYLLLQMQCRKKDFIK